MAMELTDWDDTAAMQVFKSLDPNDQIEAELVRGAAEGPYGLFADWRSMNAIRVYSGVAVDPRPGSSIPFAVLGVSNTGQAGVAEAALLACGHRRWRRQLGELGLMVRRQLPQWSANLGIRRIEARCWSDHPTASGFLTACGFRHEVTMAGFGASGSIKFKQFAWTATLASTLPGTPAATITEEG